MTGEPVIEHMASVGSTNAEMSARLGGGHTPVEGFWLVADRQTAGRGRLGREWQDGAGNFMGSTVVFPAHGDPPAHTLALVSAIAVFDTVAHMIGGRALLQLKWPNDLLLNRAKLAGILLEKVGEGIVIGIGVNLANAPDIPGRSVVSLADQGHRICRDTFALHLAAELARRVGQWREQGLAPIITQWDQRGPPPGTRIRAALSEDKTLDGRFAGLNQDGSLQIRLDDGTLHAIHAGEVSLLGGDEGE